MRLIPPRSLTNEAVKARVDRSAGPRSYEVITEDGARYRRKGKQKIRTTEAQVKQSRRSSRQKGLLQRL